MTDPSIEQLSKLVLNSSQHVPNEMSLRSLPAMIEAERKKRQEQHDVSVERGTEDPATKRKRKMEASSRKNNRAHANKKRKFSSKRRKNG